MALQRLFIHTPAAVRFNASAQTCAGLKSRRVRAFRLPRGEGLAERSLSTGGDIKNGTNHRTFKLVSPNQFATCVRSVIKPVFCHVLWQSNVCSSVPCSASMKCLRLEMTVNISHQFQSQQCRRWLAYRSAFLHNSFTKCSIFLYRIVNHPNSLFHGGVRKKQKKKDNED